MPTGKVKGIKKTRGEWGGVESWRQDSTEELQIRDKDAKWEGIRKVADSCSGRAADVAPERGKGERWQTGAELLGPRKKFPAF